MMSKNGNCLRIDNPLYSVQTASQLIIPHYLTDEIGELFGLQSRAAAAL
jgi:hypothetical protein